MTPRKHLTLGVIYSLRDEKPQFQIDYWFDNTEKHLVMDWEMVDEYLLENLGEDLETATKETNGFLCDADAFTLIIRHEDAMHNKRLADGLKAEADGVKTALKSI